VPFALARVTSTRLVSRKHPSLSANFGRGAILIAIRRAYRELRRRAGEAVELLAASTTLVPEPPLTLVTVFAGQIVETLNVWKMSLRLAWKTTLTERHRRHVDDTTLPPTFSVITPNR
jgi:hypothetical protein